MARKFALYLKDGHEVRNNIDEIKVYFDYGKLIEYFYDGQLQKWLRDRYYEKEAEALDQIHYDDKNFKEKLCAVFQVDSNTVGHAANIKDEKVQRKLDYIKQYTADDVILGKVDSVATNQDELVAMINEGKSEIYLCGDKFVLPIIAENIKYIGVGDVVGIIKSNKKVDFSERNIQFVNVRFDEEYMKLCNENIREEKGNQDEDLADVMEMAENMFSKAKEVKGKDTLKYLTLLNEAVKYGSPEAMFEFGEYYESKEHNYVKALEWYEKAAKSGETTGFVRRGCIYWKNNKLSKAKESFVAAANKDNPSGMYWLGKYLCEVEYNMERACFWFNKAAEYGHSEARQEYNKIIITGAKNVADNVSKINPVLGTAVKVFSWFNKI